MSEPTGTGMGRPSGPAFTGPPLTGTPLTGPASAGGPPDGSLPPSGAERRIGPGRSPAPGRRPPPGPPPSRLPAVLTVLAVTLVAVVVVVASVSAARDDVRRATPPPPPSATSATPVRADRIEFTTSTGSGVLEIVDHDWDADGSDVGAPGTLLTVSVRISAASGVVPYGPDSFQAFDRSGTLFQPEVLPDSSTALETGTLSAGQQVTGTVAFDIPRGGVTLLMSDDSSRTVTALKVPD